MTAAEMMTSNAQSRFLHGGHIRLSEVAPAGTSAVETARSVTAEFK